MDKNDIRLNQAKRKAIKDAWKDTIWKRTPTEYDSKLYDAVANFKQHESDVWSDVVKPTVEKNFPPEDMKVLQRYSRGSGYILFPNMILAFISSQVLLTTRKNSFGLPIIRKI